MLSRDHKLALYMEGAVGDNIGKMGEGVLRYSPNEIACVIDSQHVGQSAAKLLNTRRDAPIVASLEEAKELGATVLLLGVAPPGGQVPEAWWSDLHRAVELGFSLINGLHVRLAPKYADLAPGQWIWDVRVEPEGLTPGTGAARELNNTRVLLVGTDMAVGKMTAGLEMYAAARRKGVEAEFVATGQVGITITGAGVPLDAIRLDYAAGAIEREVMNLKDSDLVFVEGQGSLVHPASSATLPLMRGSFPTHFVICHKAGMKHLSKLSWVMIPPIEKLPGLYEDLAEVFGTFERPKTAGMSLNTVHLPEDEAQDEIKRYEDLLGFPVDDPVRFGSDKLLAALGF